MTWVPQILEHNLKSIVLTMVQGCANKDSDFVTWLLLDSCSHPAPLVAMPAPTIQANDPATMEFLKAWAFRTTLGLWSLLSRLLCLMILPSLLVEVCLFSNSRALGCFRGGADVASYLGSWVLDSGWRV